MFKLIKILFILIVLMVAGMFYLTWQSTQNPLNKQFQKGKVTAELDGFYKGDEGFKSPWLGKTFDAKKDTGINVFEYKGVKIEKARFKTYKGKGIQDKNKEVLKIDYNVSGNPFFLKAVVDEIVQVEKNKYLGKAHVTLIPNLPFTLGYFWLTK